MAAPPAKISKSRLFTRRLHVGLYVRVVMMISLGGIIATVFEQYSVADFRTLLKESQRRTEAADRGEKPAQKDVVSLREAFKPLERDTAAFSINEKKAAKADVAI